MRQVSTSERRPAVGLGRRRLPKFGGQGKGGGVRLLVPPTAPPPGSSAEVSSTRGTRECFNPRLVLRQYHYLRFPASRILHLSFCFLVSVLQFSGLGGCWSCGSPATRPDAASVAAAATAAAVAAPTPCLMIDLTTARTLGEGCEVPTHGWWTASVIKLARLLEQGTV